MLIWFLIAQTVRIKTAIPCDTFTGFRNLPLSSPKTLWEAKTRTEWQSEYAVYQSMQRTSLDLFGDLIDACRQSNACTNKLRIDTWNAKADNLGMLLGLSATMIAKLLPNIS